MKSVKDLLKNLNEEDTKELEEEVEEIVTLGQHGAGKTPRPTKVKRKPHEVTEGVLHRQTKLGETE